LEKLAIVGGTPVRKKPFPSWPRAGNEEIEWVKKVLSGSRWFAGPRGDDPESLGRMFALRFAEFHGAKYAQPVSNGSVAIEIALRAAGIGPGDEVIVPSYTFISTATSVLMVGGIPVFADIDLDTYCISVDDVERKISSKTRAIIPVHLGGQMADMPALMNIAEEKGLRVIEDCAQAIGASIDGKKAGTWGDLGTFSFQANKTITAGEGGLVLTSNEVLGERVKALTAFGRIGGQDLERSSAFTSVMLSSNYRLSELQAAVLLAQLNRFPDLDKHRQENALYLTEELEKIPGIRHVRSRGRRGHHGYYYYLISFDPDCFEQLTSEELSRLLVAEGVPFLPGDSTPIYRQPVFQPENLEGAVCPGVLKEYRRRVNLSDPGCPNAEFACRTTLVLRHQVLLGDRRDMNDIVEALAKVQRLCYQAKKK